MDAVSDELEGERSRRPGTPRKSLTLFVWTVTAWTRAVAAMSASGIFGRGTVRRRSPALSTTRRSAVGRDRVVGLLLIPWARF
jgi:hypothetical protein